MGVTTTLINKPFNPRAQDQSPKGYNRAKLYSGKALDFDGVNDDINEQTISVSSTSFSVSFYAKADNYASPLCAVSIGTSGTFDLVFYPYDDFIGNGLRIYDAQISSNLLYGVTAELGVYNLFTFQCDGEYLEVYINGQFAKKEARTYSSTYTAIKIGSILGGTQYYNGQIAGFKIFNTALTAAQVADLYNNPEKVVPTGVDNTALKLWLPMMEGAGTTAYDGSGNGNHGTISGATYVNGVGAPVAQSAVIDWNKGTNLTPNSEDFGLWILNFVSVTTNATTAPDGQSTADKIIVDSNNNFHRIYRQSYSNTTTNDLAFSVYLKYNDHQHVSFGLTDDSKYRVQIVVDLISGVVTDEHTDSANVVSSSLTDVGNGWYKLEGVITPTTAWGNNIYTMLMFQNSSTFSAGTFTNAGASVYAWGAQSQFASTNGAYILTFNASQDTPVLLPQGLTTGRDITGVNLFENVRKQGALNLDGNSWAEVHDNASLDITSAITLEAWVYWDGTQANKGLLGRWGGVANNYLIYISTNGILQFYISTTAASNIDTSTLTAGNWYHIVGTYDGSDMRIYLNGSEEANASKTGSISTSSDDIKIGRFDQQPTYSDAIAQPRIYNRALTAEEVQRNYNAGKNTYTN